MLFWPIKFCQLSTPGQNWLYEIFQIMRFDDSPFGSLICACVPCVCLLHLCFSVNCLLCLVLLLSSFHNIPWPIKNTLSSRCCDLKSKPQNNLVTQFKNKKIAKAQGGFRKKK